ncbi:MAG TPA: cysteine hydrolase family protein [Nocardioides sp.]|uniref:cysteine hydrolase family protein n=1 Tax=Nocardioides sp. TaxID=35761 RepID=UPI002F3ED43D
MTDDTNRTSALLVIDVQNANTADGYRRDEVIGNIRGLIDRAKHVGAPVIWVQHHAGGSPLERGTEGWQIVEEVRPGDGETVVEKEYLDSFVETGLRAELDRLGVGHLVICGAATDACIRSTAQRSQIEGYDVTLVADGHTTDVGPWPLPLPDGTKVPIGAEQMIAYTNFFVEDTAYPGVTTKVVNADEVEFSV